MCSTKILLAMIFNEIKCHVNTSLGLVGGDASPLCPRLDVNSLFSVAFGKSLKQWFLTGGGLNIFQGGRETLCTLQHRKLDQIS